MLILVSPLGRVDDGVRHVLARIGVTDFTEWSNEHSEMSPNVPDDAIVVVQFVSRTALGIVERLNTLAPGRVVVANGGTYFKELAHWAEQRGIHYAFLSESITSTASQIARIRQLAAA